ncbi:MAG: hypothetical protein JXQ90_07770 [Cyclobacteriaceae bacterium]
MNKLVVLIAIGTASWSCQSPTAPVKSPPSLSEILSEKIPYDSILAAMSGADQYGMRKYVIANLKRGANRSQDSTTAAQLQRAHLDNINRLAEEGKLVLAGPFMDDEDVRGIYIFAVETIEEAEALTKTDPSIQAGRLEMELRPWYGSAALMFINNLHYSTAKEDI